MDVGEEVFYSCEVVVEGVGVDLEFEFWVFYGVGF